MPCCCRFNPTLVCQGGRSSQGPALDSLRPRPREVWNRRPRAGTPTTKKVAVLQVPGVEIVNAMDFLVPNFFPYYYSFYYSFVISFLTRVLFVWQPF
ncbi:hypothetical protein GGTG_08215 [Gaeumannomyces tritici R3-111a-1]|uniref:Uncharacterized protein n=1 Tax=Gaeumannomyces tritici (strain R3-111a-1) TaxID=644352 RepID=J3P3Y0_GAET3|nr:hypothetical protein GGTG_08215 [Gaeumannomyces tritici R3-111a-1]EJT74374.1 hypothetical protein GGTG_08215 [Gaeumannomyces tritici R3-111a-1]